MRGFTRNTFSSRWIKGHSWVPPKMAPAAQDHDGHDRKDNRGRMVFYSKYSLFKYRCSQVHIQSNTGWKGKNEDKWNHDDDNNSTGRNCFPWKPSQHHNVTCTWSAALKALNSLVFLLAPCESYTMAEGNMPYITFYTLLHILKCYY